MYQEDADNGMDAGIRIANHFHITSGVRGLLAGLMTGEEKKLKPSKEDSRGIVWAEVFSSEGTFDPSLVFCTYYVEQLWDAVYSIDPVLLPEGWTWESDKGRPKTLEGPMRCQETIKAGVGTSPEILNWFAYCSGRAMNTIEDDWQEELNEEFYLEPLKGAWGEQAPSDKHITLCMEDLYQIHASEWHSDWKTGEILIQVKGSSAMFSSGTLTEGLPLP